MNCTEWDTYDLHVIGCDNCHHVGNNDKIQIYICDGHAEKFVSSSHIVILLPRLCLPFYFSSNFPKTRGLGQLTSKDDEGKLYHGNEDHSLWLYPNSKELVNDWCDTYDIERHCDHCEKVEVEDELTKYRCLGH